MLCSDVYILDVCPPHDVINHETILISHVEPFRQEKFTPVKYFSIDRVFRNETLDATHLAEFHQIEGVVADYGLTLGDLMGVLHQFFTKLGQDLEKTL